jgi:hypothetical protein
MGDLHVGDSVFGSDGKVYIVEAIYPQGIRPVYRITFNDKFSTECDINHLWQVRDINRRKRETGWIVKSTKELIQNGIVWNPCKSRIDSNRKPLLKWEIPLVKSVEYAEKKHVIHPYIMGMLLGDGYMCGRHVCISIPDKEMESVKRISNLLPPELKLRANRYSQCPQYYVTQTNTTRKNPFKEEILRLGVNIKGKQKFIPDEYLYSSTTQRMQLLQGLMDSDGSAKNNRITFHTCSEKLANNIAELVQSLGGYVVIRKYNREHEGKNVEWQLNIRTDFCPFQLERKAANWKPRKYSRYIQLIEYLGEKETQCIKVSAQNHLYITDHFIVTHNTAQAIATILAANAFPCLVICPSSLKINWEREWDMWTTRKALILNDSIRRTFPYFYEARMAHVFIANYESLKKYFVEEINQPVDVETGKKKPLTLKHIKFNDKIGFFKSVIVDESHRVKDLKTQQTKFTKGICSNKEYILLLTGTPVVNKPKDLIPQLGIIDRMNDFGGYRNFTSCFCDREDKWRELNVLLRRNCFYRREKTEVLKQLPAKIRQAVLCDITTRKEYGDALKDLEIYLRRYRQASDEQVEKSLRGEIMVRIGILKNISARGKLDDVIDYVSDVIDSGEKIILFVHLKEVAEKLKRVFPAAATILGSDDSQTRQRSIDNFQNDANCQLIICSIKAAGVGITLTASSRVAFVELPWHPADCEQCEDRAHRIGQTDSVQCTYFLGKETIDEWIYSVINEKREMTKQITGAREEVEESVLNGVINLLSKNIK